MKIDLRYLSLGLLLTGLSGALVACSGRGSGTGTPYYGPGTGPVGSFTPIFKGGATSSIGSISAGPKMNTKRQLHTATAFNRAGLYVQGGILVVGGEDAQGTPIPGAEVFDADKSTWTPVEVLNTNQAQSFLVNTRATGGAAVTARSRHVGVSLATGNGKILIAGGQGSEDSAQTTLFMKTCFVFDAGSNSFGQVDDMPQPRSEFQGILLSNGQVLIVAGFIPPLPPAPQGQIGVTAKSAARFVPTNPPGSQWVPIGGGASTAVTAAHWGGVMVSSGNNAIICGGANVNLVQTQQGIQRQLGSPGFPPAGQRCETYTTSAQTFGPGPTLATDRVFAAGTAILQGDAIMAGGLSANAQGQFTVSNSIDRLDHLKTPPKWDASGPMPLPPTFLTAQSPDESRQGGTAGEVDAGRTGNVLISGGLDAQGGVKDTACLWELKFTAVQLKPAAAPAGVLKMSEKRNGQANACLNDGRFIICGGFNGQDVTDSVDIYSR